MPRSRTPCWGCGSLYWLCGGVLLSRRVAPAVPSALAGLASGFGMGPGVSPPPWPPQHRVQPCQPVPAQPAPCGGGWGVCGWGLVNRIVDASACAGFDAWGAPSRRGGGGWVSPRPISTSPLSPLRGVHVWPIDPLVWRGPYPHVGGGRPHLEEGFPLRCFQRLSRPDVANQPCPWRDNWHTRGPSIPVLSY